MVAYSTGLIPDGNKQQKLEKGIAPEADSVHAENGYSYCAIMTPSFFGLMPRQWIETADAPKTMRSFNVYVRFGAVFLRVE